MEKREDNVLVFGAGIAGLSSAYTLAKAGVPVTVLEIKDYVGGLATSFEVEVGGEKFVVDHGPHRFHSGEAWLIEHLKEVTDDKLVMRDRISRIFLFNRWFDYPLKAENVLRTLPIPILIKAFWDFGLVKLASLFKKRTDDNFEQWVVNRFGWTLYKAFFGIYTEKTWGLPCTEISADWASQRISILSLWDAVVKTLFKSEKNTPRSYVSKFFYPEQGGIGELCNAYARKVVQMGGKIHLGTSAKRITLDENGDLDTVEYTVDGETIVARPSTVVSTMPLQPLMLLLDPKPPEEILKPALQLRYRALVFIYIFLNKERVTHDNWIYVPEQEHIINRISEFKNFCDSTCPPGKTAVCCEITCWYDDETWSMEEEKIVNLVIDDLVSIGLIKRSEVIGHHRIFLRNAYPVYDHFYKDRLEGALEYVKKIGRLDTSGRQGLFKYNNMDHSVNMGVKVAHTIMGTEEDHMRVASGDEYFG
ncbi:MAG: FAD-dependent oxidoreductase [Myxococcales bacterium]|nr:FAD-dependent oxidoreductase [Myxococcales bacterium]